LPLQAAAFRSFQIEVKHGFLLKDWDRRTLADSRSE
jgi:hypothetical protein